MALKKTPCSYLRIGLRLPLPNAIVTSTGGLAGAERDSSVGPFNVPGNAHRNFSTLTLAVAPAPGTGTGSRSFNLHIFI